MNGTGAGPYSRNANLTPLLATKWTTLSEFIKELGSRADCLVEETPKGWFITFTPLDSEESLRRRLRSKRHRESTEDRQLEAVSRIASIYSENDI